MKLSILYRYIYIYIYIVSIDEWYNIIVILDTVSHKWDYITESLKTMGIMVKTLVG